MAESASPRLLLCDTDALIQLFLTKDATRKLVPLRSLKDVYGIQPAIVAEVELELHKTRHYLNQFDNDLKKAISNGTLLPLDESAFGAYVSPSHHAKSVYAAFQSLGKQYSRHVQRGESYSLAAAVTLHEPALSNDNNALEVLDKQGFTLPSPVLRVFDLFVLCFQTGDLTEKECDSTRQELVRLEEHVPRVFQKASFVDGLAKFCPRFVDADKPAVGLPPSPCPGHQTPCSLKRLK